MTPAVALQVDVVLVDAVLTHVVPTALAVSLASVCAEFEGTRVFGTGVSSCSGAWAGLAVSAGQAVETGDALRIRAAKLFALKPLAPVAVEQPVLVGQSAQVDGFSGHEQGLDVRGYVGGGQQQDRPAADRLGSTTNGNTGTNGTTSTNGTTPIDPWELRISSPPG